MKNKQIDGRVLYLLMLKSLSFPSRNIDRMLAQFPDQYNKSDLTPYMYNDILSGLDVDTVKKMAPEVCSLQEDLDKAAEGTGLAFIVFTQAIVEFPAAPFWSIIFFLMLLTLGLGSQFGTVESVITSITDMSISPAMKRKEIVAGKRPVLHNVCVKTVVIGVSQHYFLAQTSLDIIPDPQKNL